MGDAYDFPVFEAAEAVRPAPVAADVEALAELLAPWVGRDSWSDRVDEWHPDEAAAYRTHGGFTDGRAAAEKVRARRAAVALADLLAGVVATARAEALREARVFVVRRQAGYAAGVYDSFEAAAEAVDKYLSAFPVHEIVEPLYHINPDSPHAGWWRLYFRVRGGPVEEIEIVEHEVRARAATEAAQ